MESDGRSPAGESDGRVAAGRRRRRGLVLGLLLFVACGARPFGSCESPVPIDCGPPPFVVNVTYPGEVDVEPGSPVIYQGIRIGRVEAVSLRQDAPEQPALVEVKLGIRDRHVVLRESDRFHQSTLRGVPVIEVEPAETPSEPLAAGATVAGVPPLLTRLEESLGTAAESLGALAEEAIERAIESLDEDTRARLGDALREIHPTPPPTPDPQDGQVPVR